MNSLKRLLEQWPATLTILITFLCVGALFVVKTIEIDPNQLVNLPRILTITAISAIVCVVLTKCNWAKDAGLTLPLRSWHPKWYLATLPLLSIALLSATSANWDDAQFNIPRVSAWILANVATGFFEEVLMRGLCFFILLKAWGNSKKGLYCAALFQAAIFGIAHIGNLYTTPMLDVFAQVIFATLIGIGFAGLVFLTKSLWPAIIVHTVINSVGSVNDHLVPGAFEFQSPGLIGYVVIIIIFFVLSTIPGLFYLRAGKPRDATSAH